MAAPNWNRATAEAYEKWLDSPTGRFAYAQEARLVRHLISGWPRRNQRLLEVGCGTGFFLHLFYDSGFDITGLDSSPDMLQAARQRVGRCADLHLGHADHLPFDDKEFDFVALLTVLEFLPDPAAALREAYRVARKGILVAFLNKLSLYYLTHGLDVPCLRPLLPKATLLRNARWFSPWAMRALMVSVVGHKPMTGQCVLPGPLATWRDNFPCRMLNGSLYPLSIGSFCALRADLVDEVPLTPIFSFSTQPGTAR